MGAVVGVEGGEGVRVGAGAGAGVDTKGFGSPHRHRRCPFCSSTFRSESLPLSISLLGFFLYPPPLLHGPMLVLGPIYYRASDLKAESVRPASSFAERERFPPGRR